MDELSRLRAELAAERAKREEEQRRREAADERADAEQNKRKEEQRRREEEQRRRQNVELLSVSAAKQSLSNFLLSCHHLSTMIKPVTDHSSATGGNTTNPTHRLFPQHILPWTDFPARQSEIWDHFSSVQSIWTRQTFPSSSNLDYVGTMIDPIGSEDDLRYIQRLAVENMVKTLFDQVQEDDEVRAIFDVDGNISFENQARFRNAEDQSLEPAMGKLSVSGSIDQRPRNRRADQFCVNRNKHGIPQPLVAIEYKPPHKLTLREICTGLRSEIHPEWDVIDKHDDDFESLCKYLMTAVITQLFSYMIDTGVRYGYVCTGEAYVFLYIPNDPSTVYYSVNIPKRDCEEDLENRLQRTAVSQVFAFVQQALREEPLDQAWMDQARMNLKRWKVEFYNILADIPETERQSRDTSDYRPSKWISTKRSPIALRSRCDPLQGTSSRDGEDPSSGSEDDNMQSPTPYIRTRSRAAADRARSGRVRPRGSCGNSGGQGRKGRGGESNQSIEDRPYCTHLCLLGLSQGLAMDPSCPNAARHNQHISQETFLRLIRAQLTIDRGKNADCRALHIHGSRGSLLKVCLTSHGYTLVAKGFTLRNLPHLRNEERVYTQLQKVQGRHVPVCCGVTDLQLPYYYHGEELTHLLFMSWAGKSLTRGTGTRPSILRLSTEALQAIHCERVIHCDSEPRNMLYDENSQNLMIVDFERSKICDRTPLGVLSSNRKRKRAGAIRKQCNRTGKSCFAKDLATAHITISDLYD